MQTENIKSELEERNRFLEKEIIKLIEEQVKCSRRASEIMFILASIKGEIAANRQIIQKLKGQEKKD